ncbi:hypothetical protein [Streptomyces sp. NBRC 109706]|uniref:hypothetical protein n=1 Tax=Streptomyces sp. NBRC 109706 TaxID=1550035 RepID=UPI000785D1B4|nr:hypothetical protein [Streptomyces sp. NBRC 109706]
MFSFFATVVGLALAGLDPIGALIAVGGLAAGATRRAILVFTALSLLIPPALGVPLSLLVGASVARVDLSGVDWHSPWWALGEAAIALALLWWAVRRRRRPHPGVSAGTARGGGAGRLALLAVLLALTILLDPTFLGLVVLAGREPVWELVVAHLLWSLVSQAPLVLVGGAVAAGRHRAAVRLLERASARLGPAVRHGVTLLLVLVALVLLADVAVYVATGGEEYLLG